MAINRILVADDEQSIRWVLSKSLTKQGFSIDLAEDGSEARQLAAENHYDLAVIDIKMPGIDGLELLRHFQEKQPGLLVLS